MQFLKTDGQLIVNEDGREVLLEGYGIGNWMNQEGFLFGSSQFSAVPGGFARSEGMDRGRTINQTIIETCGPSYAKDFWNRFYRAYFNRADIEHIARMGMNSVRLPLKAAAFLPEDEEIAFDEETFRMLDDLIDACEENGIYVILDMHAAVVGQSAIGCDDGVDNVPHLYTDAEGWERTILLWEEFARRYRDRAAVAGYELLNEPLALPMWDNYLPELVRFYEETIRRIRAIDTKHIIFLQGHRFASRWDIFKKEMDPGFNNWVLTVHMYETLPDLGAIGPMLAVREALDVPVWMGETGGSSSYMTVLYEMLREHHIGVNIWCHKAVHGADAATLATYALPDGFEKITAYAQRGGPKPSYKESRAIFDQYLENVRFGNCTLHESRVNAILRRADVRVPATGYDCLPGAGKSFHGTWPYAAFCGYRREDRMHIAEEKGYMPLESAAFAWAAAGRPPKYGDWPHLELQLDEGEFACYTIRHVTEPVSVYLECTSEGGAELLLTTRGLERGLQIPEGSAMEDRKACTVEPGEDTPVCVKCLEGSVRLKSIRFR